MPPTIRVPPAADSWRSALADLDEQAAAQRDIARRALKAYVTLRAEASRARAAESGGRPDAEQGVDLIRQALMRDVRLWLDESAVSP